MMMKIFKRFSSVLIAVILCVVSIPIQKYSVKAYSDMAERILNDTSLGIPMDKKETMAIVTDAMLDAGFEPAFITGVLGNIYYEGNFGKFESSNYKSNPSAKPDYLINADKEWNYATLYSGQNIVGKDLSTVYNMAIKYRSSPYGNRIGFGLGCVQWTFDRTVGLINKYREIAGSSNYITKEQVMKAECLFMVYEFQHDVNHGIKSYNTWKANNSNNLSSADAAYSAGSLVCIIYEAPKDATSKAPDRAAMAKKIYNVCFGGTPLPCKINDISGYDGPKDGYVHTPGANCGLYGTITSNHPLKHVWGGVYNQDGSKAPGSSTTCDDYPSSTSYSLRGTFNNTIVFDDIPVGSYFFSISAEDNDGYSREVYHCNFTVGNPNITVSFDANGGTVSPTSKTYQIGGKYSDLPTPSTRKGYIFDGWYSTANGGTKVTNGSSLVSSSAHTLYAHWKDDMRKIYFNANGGICSTEYITRRYGDKYGDMPVPTNSGYRFLGWYTAAQGGELRNASSEVVEVNNYTLYAHWSVDDYTVVFNSNGGSGSMSKQSIARDQSVALTVNTFTAPKGYAFSKWNTKSDGSGTSYTDKQTVKNIAPAGGSITLYAIWQPNKYSIKFNANGGSGTMGDQVMTYDQASMLTKNAFTRTGYSFESWSDGKEPRTYYSDQQSVKNLATSGTVTLWVKWKANTYKVTLDDGSGKTSTINVTYDSKYGLPATDPVKDGYNFAGWYTEKDGKGTLISGDTTVKITAAQTLYAYWSKIDYLITFNANGGISEMSQKRVSYDTKYGVLPIAEKQGYDFGGWYLDKELTQQITADSIVKITKNQEVYAKWEQVKVVITFDANGGTVDKATKKVVAGKVYGVLPEAEKEGFEFAGWFTKDGTEITSTSTVEITVDTTVYAKWRLKGDVDADGDVDVDDVIMLQQWLLAVPDATLNDWRAGDLCKDERIDVFDLCLLKRMLLERNGEK